MRQACSFARMLAELPEVSNPGELIVGSTQGALAKELPSGVDEAEYQKAEKTVEQELNLPFIARWDHACPDYQTLLELGVGGILEKSKKNRKNKASGRAGVPFCYGKSCRRVSKLALFIGSFLSRQR